MTKYEFNLMMEEREENLRNREDSFKENILMQNSLEALGENYQSWLDANYRDDNASSRLDYYHEQTIEIKNEIRDTGEEILEIHYGED